MPATVQILPAHGLAYVRYVGIARIDESFALTETYMRLPDYRPGLKQLIDLSAVTGLERDFARIVALQARMADVLDIAAADTLAVILAPTPVGREMAEIVRRSWEGFPGVVSLMQEDEAGALALLGLRETRIAALFEAAT